MTSTAPTTDTAATPAKPAEQPGRLRYVPALDGIRGIFIWVELLVHAGYGTILPSGFLVISMFFTISGYLITSLLIGEHAKTSAISLKNFWSRRFRRLMPAAMAALAVIVVAGQVARLWAPFYFKRDVLWTLGYVANWRFVLTNRTYALAFNSSPSPVQHFWSLAIEEQVYVTLPLVFMGVMWLRKRWWPAPFVVFGTLAAISTFLSAHFYSPSGWSRSYYGTDTRVAEVLVGVLLAFAVATPRYRSFLASERGRRVIAVVGCIGIVSMVSLWMRGTIDGPFVYKGGFLLNATFTGMTILGCTVVGPVEWLLRKRVLVYLGKTTYGIYLVQWPLFLVLTQHHVFPNRFATFVGGSAISIAVAGISYKYLESPIRYGHRLKSPRVAFAAPAASVILVGLLAAIVPIRAPKTNAIDLQRLGNNASTSPYGHRIMVLGDSMAWTMALGLQTWGKTRDTGLGWLIGGGCGVGHEGQVRYLGIVQKELAACGIFDPNADKQFAAFNPQVVVIMASGSDLSDRRFGSGPWEHVGQPAFDTWLLGQYEKVYRRFASPGRKLVFVTEPTLHAPNNPPATAKGPLPENQPARLVALNALIKRFAARHPDTTVIDLYQYALHRPGGPLDPNFRTDGVHFSFKGTDEVARWIGPQLLKLTPR